MHAANEHETGRTVETSVRREEETSGVERKDQAADARAMAAVGAGAVGRLDHAGARSLQRMAGNAAFSTAIQREASAVEQGALDGSSVHEVVGSGGSPLDSATHDKMSSAFGGVDFSDVRVHSDSAAQESAKSVQAKAYTAGTHVVLGEGVSPGSPDGQRTLAHELTHVVQQSVGADLGGVAQQGGTAVTPQDHATENEAERNADAVMGGSHAEVASAGIGSSSGGASVQALGLQREDDDVPGEDVMTMPLQREALQRSTAPEEDEGV